MYSSEIISDILIERFTKSEEYLNFNIENTKSITGLKGGSDSLLFASLFQKNSILIINKLF